jgi:hypothetical protein
MADNRECLGQGPGPGLIRVRVPKRLPYVPILSETERRAYHVAHRLLGMFHIVPVNRGDVREGREGTELAGAGARRSWLVDEVARVVKEEMEK